MRTTDLLARWSVQSLDEIEAELMAGDNLAAAEQLYGADEVAKMREAQIAGVAPGPHEAVVLLPGLMGSLLSSIQGVTSLLWINPAIIVQGLSRYLELDHTGAGDASPEVLSVPIAVEKLVYLKIALILRRRSQLFEFPYDWRRPIEANGDVLWRAIEKWSDGDDSKQFTLVGHSMGGLVSRAYLARHREHAKKHVKRVIMHGTPHFGAAGAIADLFLGNQFMAIATTLNGNNDVRRMVINMPSAYELLPAPPDLFPKDRAYPVDFDVYDSREWHLDGIRQEYLDAGKRFHELLADHDHPVEMIEIAGCHEETTVEVKQTFDGDKAGLEVIRQNEGPDSGDATVPLYSARLPGAAMYYIQQVHRYLSRNDDVIEATLDLIDGQTPKLPTALPKRKGGLFGVAEVEAPPEVTAEELRVRLATGTATSDDLEKLYFVTG